MAFVNSKTSLYKKTGYFYEGKEISLEKKSGFPTKEKRHNNGWWPQDKKVEAATVFAVTRNYEKTSDLVKIPVSYLKRMSQEGWWGEIIDKVIKSKNEQLDAKITETLDQSLDLILDRFKNGETYYNLKTEKEYKLPIKAKDTAIITSILFDKRQLIRGEATSRTENVTSEQKLLALKANFEKLAKSKNININSEPIEGELLETSKENLNAEPIQQTSPPDGGGSPQSSIREEDGDSSISGEGVQPSGQRDGDLEKEEECQILIGRPS